MASDSTFTEPEDDHDAWIDVRMTDPEVGEWDVDAVIVDGQVEYVDLRIRPSLLTSFVDCLVDDVDNQRAQSVIASLARTYDVDLSSLDKSQEQEDGGDASLEQE